MAHQGSFSSHSSQSPHISTPASTSSMVSGAALMANTTFSVFQESPGMPLVYSPPRGTLELQTLVDQFIALNIPMSMKMEMIQRDFESHFQRTGDRYKTYIVPTTAAPSPVFPMEPVSYQSGPENYLGLLDSSSSDAGLDSMYTFSLPTISSQPLDLFQTADMLPVSTITGFTASPAWLTDMPATTTPLATASSFVDWAIQPRQRQTTQASNRSMQILTRDGEDITHLSSRTTRTNQERESTRIVRRRGACASCRRKKVRCDPSHMGHSPSSASRATPYLAPVMSGRAKEEMLADKAAKTAKEKRESKKPVTTADPVILAPHTMASALSTPSFNSSCQNTAAFGATDSISLDLNMFQNSFDWTLSTAEEIDQQIAAALTVDTTANTVMSQPRLSRVPSPESLHAITRRQEAGESASTSANAYDGHSVLPILPPDRPPLSSESGSVSTVLETQFGLDNGDGSSFYPSSQTSSSVRTPGLSQTLPASERERHRHHRPTLQNGQTGGLSVVTSSSASQQETAQTACVAGGLLDMISLYAGMAELASSLLPSLLAWAASQAEEKSTADMASGMKRLNLGSTLVACQ